MANIGGNQFPKIHSVYVETNFYTRLVVPLNHDESVLDFQDKVCDEHNKSFPEMEEINITAFKAENRGKLFRLPAHMNVSQAFDETRGNWHLYADAFKVEKVDLVATVVADQKCSNPELAQGDKEIGIDSLVDVHNKDPSVEEGLAEIQVAEKTTGKRKVVMSDGERSGKKRSKEVEGVEGVVATLKSESCAVLPSKEVDDVLTGDVGKENEKGEKSVLDSDQLANHLEKKRKSSKYTTKKKKSKKSKSEDRLVASGAENLEPVQVVDGEGADSLQEKKSKKKYKKKHSEKTVDDALVDALYMPAKKVTGDSEDNYVSTQIMADMGDNFYPSQKDEIAGLDKKQDQVMNDVAKSEKETKVLDLHHGCSIEGSLNSMKPKAKKARAQPARSVTSHLKSVVKNDHSGSKVDLSDASVKGTVDNKKKISNGSIDGSLSLMKPNEKKTKSKYSDVSSRTPSNDDSDVVTSVSRKQGTNLAGGTDRSLQDSLRSLKIYKEAEDKYVDDESLALLYVPDSLSN